MDKDTVPTLQNISNVMDFVFDPFDNNCLVVGKSLILVFVNLPTLDHVIVCVCAACEDARIKVWTIPKEGLTQTLSEPEFCLIGVCVCV